MSRRYRLKPTKSFRKLAMETDDIPVSIVASRQPHYLFVIDLGQNEEAYLYVSESAVEKVPEYFQFYNNN